MPNTRTRRPSPPLRQVRDQAGTDDGFDAGRLQLLDLGTRILVGHVGALDDRHVEGCAELGQFRVLALVGDHADALRHPARARQRLQHVETAGLRDDHRHGHAPFQVGSVRTSRDQHIAAFGGDTFADMPDRFVLPAHDRYDRGEMIVFERDVAEQAAQPRHGNGPEDRLVIGH
jgi:hypothetical protein